MVVSDSKYGMMTRCWGPCLWTALHMMSLNYPVDPSPADKHHYLTFFRSLKWTLPCKSCRESYGKFIAAKGRRTHLSLGTMRSRESLARWMYEVHCAVSKRIGKKTTISFEGMCKKFEVFRAGHCNAHGCDAEAQKKRKRTVVMVMDDETYKRMGLRGSLIVM